MTSAGGGSMSFPTPGYYVDALLSGDEYRWNYDPAGTPLSLTYGFMTVQPFYANPSSGSWFGNEFGSFQSFSVSQRAGVDRAIQNYENVCNVDFTFLANGDAAQVRFGNALLDASSAAHAYYPERSVNGDWEGDVWFNTTETYLQDQSAGSYGYFVTLHEIGHTLGLKHSHDWQQGGMTLPYTEDSRQYTVMSYNAHPSSPDIEPSSLLLYDIAALQYLYGANTSYKSGNDTWRWNSNESFVACIWDGGGTDTLDASNQTRRVVIDLTPGKFSSLGAYQGGNAFNNLAIAFDCWIENAIGGGGNDTIGGNALANRLEGGAGDDALFGHGGGDIIIGGAGLDTVSYAQLGWQYGGSSVTVDLATGVFGGAAAGDQLFSIERIIGSGASDTLIGDAGNNWLAGGFGADVLVGGAGADTLIGGANAFEDDNPWDEVSYAASATGVTVNLTAGTGAGGDAQGDTFTGIENVTGSSFNDILIGKVGSNTLRGGAGDDVIDGRSGSGGDAMYGGTGNDTFYVDDDSDYVYENSGEGIDQIFSTRSFHLTTSVEKLTFTGTGDFEAIGNALDNTLVGGGGNDRLTGSTGNDTLNGGGGSDTAVFSGTRANYQTSKSDGIITVTDLRGIDGVDALTAVELLRFADGTFAANAAPVVTVANKTAAHGQRSIAASALYTSITDADAGDSVARYRFFDGTLGHGIFLLDGAPQVERLNFEIDAAQLSTVEFRLGSTGSDVLWIQAYDGYDWSAWSSFTVTPYLNTAPVASPSDPVLARGTISVAASSLFITTDADGDPMTRYRLYDGTAGNGQFFLGGAPQATRSNIEITAAQLASVEFVLGSAGTSDQLWVQAFDGVAWSAWSSFTVTAPQNAAPTAIVNNWTPARGTAVIAAANLVTPTDPDGDTITLYKFFDGTAGNGYFRKLGIDQPELTNITVTAAELADTQFALGGGQDVLWVQVYDGMSWSAWKSFTVNPPQNNAPVVSINTGSLTPARGVTSIAASSFFTVGDSDGDVITQYRFFDGTAGNGNFTRSGAPQTELVNLDVAAGDLAMFRYQVSGTGAGDTLWVQAFDGISWSTWKSFAVLPPQNNAPVVTVNNLTPGKTMSSIAGASLFSVSDADGDAVTQYRFFDGTLGNGRFLLDGGEQVEHQNITINAADLADFSYRTSTTGTGDTLWVQAFDGTAWGAWKSFTVGAPQNNAPQVTVSDRQESANTAIAASTLFTVSDPDNDPISRYQFWDSTSGGGAFNVSGTPQPWNATIEIMANQLAATTFVTGGAAGTDQLWARAFDGTSWGQWKTFNLTTLASS
jgi:hypothetical protein